MQLTVNEKQKQARDMQQRMRVVDGQSIEDKERELQKMRDTHELTMTRLKDKKTGIEDQIRGLKDQAQQTLVEVNKLKG